MSIKERFHWSRDPIFLIDGTSFLYRAFYAYPDLNRSDGFPTNALYIVLRLLLKIIRQEQPRYACFLLDDKRPSFRQDIMDSYKAQRQKMPEPLSLQIPPLLEGVKLLGIKQITGQEGEADDYIASFAHRFKSQAPVVILGSDKDLLQCLDQQVIVWDPGQRKEKIVSLHDFKDSEGLSPEQWPDFQALTGDKSDNIPGVPGVGPKTARNLLQRYPTLEAIRDQFDHLTRKEQEKLQAHIREIFTYRELTRLRIDLGEDLSLQDCSLDPPATAQLAAFFQKYEFKSLLGELGAIPGAPFPNDPGKASVQVQFTVQQQEHELPNLKGRQVGLWFDPDSERSFLGCDHKEFQIGLAWEGLFPLIKHTSAVFVPSSKELLQNDQGWEQLLDRMFDLSLMAYLINPEEKDYGWEHLVQVYHQQAQTHQDNPGLSVLSIGRLLLERLHNANLTELLQSVETPLVPVLAAMEKRGLGIDLQAFQSFLQDVEDRIQELSRSIFDRAGESFNLRSPQQLAEILFIKLGLKTRRKTPGGLPSTAVPVLEGLRSEHPIIEEILEFRALEKLRSTYLAPLPRQTGHDQRLHSTFNQLGTATGRLSSSRPNLQNIPIRGEFGTRMRSCFVPKVGCCLVAADYSQVELRILAHFSQDENLLEAFKLGQDIHTRTAALIFDTAPEAISPDQRRKAKTVNFGLLYGMGPRHLGQELGIPMQEAKKFIAVYFERLEKVRRFYQQTEDRAREYGFVTTLAGRRRVLKDIHSRNDNLAAQARRMAINTVVQGSAADIIKMAMNRVYRDEQLKELSAGLVLQIHDELLLEAPEENGYAVGIRTAEIMSRVVDLSVPLLVDWGLGQNWGEAH